MPKPLRLPGQLKPLHEAKSKPESSDPRGQKVVQQDLNIQPTLTVRPGFPVRVIVNRDLMLEPDEG
jgi:type IV secretion system protein TrbI